MIWIFFFGDRFSPHKVKIIATTAEKPCPYVNDNAVFQVGINLFESIAETLWVSLNINL